MCGRARRKEERHIWHEAADAVEHDKRLLKWRGGGGGRGGMELDGDRGGEAGGEAALPGWNQ